MRPLAKADVGSSVLFDDSGTIRTAVVTAIGSDETGEWAHLTIFRVGEMGFATTARRAAFRTAPEDGQWFFPGEVSQ